MPTIITPDEQDQVALPKTPAKGHGKKVQFEIEEPEAIAPEGTSLFLIYLFPSRYPFLTIIPSADQAKVAPAKGHGKKVRFKIEDPEAIEPAGNSPLVYVFPFLFFEISITNHHCFIEEPMPTKRAKRGRGKKAQFIDNALSEEQMAQVLTKPRGKKATPNQAQSVPANTGRVTRSKTAANKHGEENENKATKGEQKNAPNAQPAVSNNRGRKAKVTKAVEPDADEIEAIEEEPKPFAELQLIITPTSNQAEQESLSKTPRAKRAAARNEQRAATPVSRRSTRGKKQAVEHIGDEEHGFAATKKPFPRHKVEPTQKITKTRGKAKGRRENTRKQMDEELTQVESLEEQDAMEGIRETPFIHKQIEQQDQVAQAGALDDQDAMEGIREPLFINVQIQEQDPVAQAGAHEEQDAMEGIKETPLINEQIEEQDAMEGIEETLFNKQIEEQDQVTQGGALEDQGAMEGIRGTPFINEQIEEQDQVAQTGALEEQDAMEGIREAAFINEQIEEQDAMEGIEATPVIYNIHKQIEEQDQVAQAKQGDTMMLEYEYPSMPNIAEEPVRQTSSLAAVECPEFPEFEMLDV